MFKLLKRMSNTFRFKDQLPSQLNLLVLYKYKCDTCNSVYLGKTRRHFLERQYEYLRLSVLTNKAFEVQ